MKRQLPFVLLAMVSIACEEHTAEDKAEDVAQAAAGAALTEIASPSIPLTCSPWGPPGSVLAALALCVDDETGCQYWASTAGLSPRVAADGQHLGCHSVGVAGDDSGVETIVYLGADAAMRAGGSDGRE